MMIDKIIASLVFSVIARMMVKVMLKMMTVVVVISFCTYSTFFHGDQISANYA